MKNGIHPANYKKLRIKIGSDVFDAMSCCGQDEILMDVDFRKHPAWTKQGVLSVNSSNANVSSFNKKFSGLDLSFLG